jgi:hypothetical protein
MAEQEEAYGWSTEQRAQRRGTELAHKSKGGLHRDEAASKLLTNRKKKSALPRTRRARMSCWMTCSGRRAGRAPAPASRARRATTAARSRACRRRSFPASHSKRMRILATEQQTAEAPRGGGHHQRREAAASAGTGRGAGEATGKKRSLRRSLSWAEASVKAHIVREAQSKLPAQWPTSHTNYTLIISRSHSLRTPSPTSKIKKRKRKRKEKKGGETLLPQPDLSRSLRSPLRHLTAGSAPKTLAPAAASPPPPAAPCPSAPDSCLSPTPPRSAPSRPPPHPPPRPPLRRRL